MKEPKAFQRKDDLWNFIKPDGNFLCEEWFKSETDWHRCKKAIVYGSL